jgi:hypothetical protein
MRVNKTCFSIDGTFQNCIYLSDHRLLCLITDVGVNSNYLSRTVAFLMNLSFPKRDICLRSCDNKLQSTEVNSYILIQNILDFSQ